MLTRMTLVKKLLLAWLAMGVCAGVTRAQTVETNTFAEINQMATMWEGNPLADHVPGEHPVSRLQRGHVAVHIPG